MEWKHWQETLLEASINFTTLTLFGLSNAINCDEASPRSSSSARSVDSAHSFERKKLHSQWETLRVWKAHRAKKGIVKCLVLQFHKKINKFCCRLRNIRWILNFFSTLTRRRSRPFLSDHVTCLWKRNETYSFCICMRQREHGSKINTP